MLYNLFENRAFVSVFAVALLAEGVDRNVFVDAFVFVELVALLAEGVDRNISKVCLMHFIKRSPSSRRAWIEILHLHHGGRNRPGRPPRGGRG